MKSETLLDAIGMISDNAIVDAKNNRRLMTHSRIKWAAVAACLCLVACIITVPLLIHNNEPSSPPVPDPEKGYALTYNRAERMTNNIEALLKGCRQIKLTEDELSSILPEALPTGVSFTGVKWLNEDGEIVCTDLLCVNLEAGTNVCVMIIPGEIVSDFILSSDPILSYCFGESVNAGYWDSGNEIFYYAIFAAENMNYYFTAQGSRGGLQENKMYLSDDVNDSGRAMEQLVGYFVLDHNRQITIPERGGQPPANENSVQNQNTFVPVPTPAPTNELTPEVSEREDSSGNDSNMQNQNVGVPVPTLAPTNEPPPRVSEHEDSSALDGGISDQNTVKTPEQDESDIDAPIAGMYRLTIAAGVGGTIPAGLDTRIDGEYEQGEQIRLIARPNPGYVFDKWTSSNGGDFVDAHSIDTEFIMPEADTVITANFIPAGNMN